MFSFCKGVLWLFLATAAEVPPAVFILLNLNAPLAIMFILPAWITMAIAATRMHRLLVEFASGSTDIFIGHEVPQSRNPPIQNTKRLRTPPNPLNRMELTVRMSSKQDIAPHKGDGSSSSSTADKVHGGSSGDDIVERDV